MPRPGTRNRRHSFGNRIVQPASDALTVLESVGVELQRARVLADDPYLVVGVAVLVAGGDLQPDLQLDVVGGGEVPDDLLGDLGQVWIWCGSGSRSEVCTASIGSNRPAIRMRSASAASLKLPASAPKS